MIGFIEAMTYFVGPDKEFDEMNILSLASLEYNKGKLIGEKTKKSVIEWGSDLIYPAIDGGSYITNYMMEKINDNTMFPVKYLRIPSREISPDQARELALDNSSEKMLNLMKQKGYDQGIEWVKKPKLLEFFKTNKLYIIREKYHG